MLDMKAKKIICIWKCMDIRARWTAAYTSGTVDTAAEAISPIAKEFCDFYRTSRGSVGDIKKHTTHSTLTSNTKFMNFYPFNDVETISPRPLLFVK